jgi:hypothetical protein
MGFLRWMRGGFELVNEDRRGERKGFDDVEVYFVAGS